MSSSFTAIALMVAIVLGVQLGWTDSLNDAWSAWLAGESMSDVTLWGRSMRFWERVGKGCIFMAGLSVLLDLADPETLRRRGHVATQRIQKARTRATAIRAEIDQARNHVTKAADRAHNWHEYRQSAVVLSLVGVVGAPQVPITIPTLLGPEQRAKRIAELVEKDNRTDEAELLRFHESILSRGNEECTRSSRCFSLDNTDGGPICDACKSYIHDAVKRYVDGLVTDEEQALISRGREVRRRTEWIVLVALLLPVGLLIGGLTTLALNPGVAKLDSWVSRVLLGILLLGCISVQALARIAPRHQLALLLEVRALAAAPAVVSNSAVAAVLDKARPGHVFRWVAFVLFVIGSHFDLLST